MLFEEKVLKRLASPDAFRGGREFMLARQVRNIVIERNQFQDFLVRGEIVGTTTQRAELVVAANKQTVKSHKCTCPFDRQGMCKHVVALGLSAVEPLPGAAANDPQAALRALFQKPSRFSQAAQSTMRQVVVTPSAAGSGLVFRGANTAASTTHGKLKQHGLDEIRFRLHYDFPEDTLFVEAVAEYGPFSFSLFDGARRAAPAEVDERGFSHEALRDAEAERAACQWFVQEIEDGFVDGDGRIAIEGEKIYPFLKKVYPELEFRYPIDLDPAAQEVVGIQAEAVEGAWKTRVPSGVDLFAFSVDWHCQQTTIDVEALRRMVHEGRPYVRAADGRFIECENYKEIVSWVETLDRAKKTDNNEFVIPLYEAPGFLALLHESRRTQALEMDQVFQRFLTEAKQGRPLEAVDIPGQLATILRPYQRDGVAWMLFLQKYGFAGILADDMGLGKTVQVLAMLSSSRLDGHGPTFIVCPKSLMLMWAAESAKFTPELRVCVIDGSAAERANLIRTAREFDVVITSYSLLQRDFAVYHTEQVSFYYVVLDEAHYIKNAGTNTAKAVKLLSARHRLALTGTPLENGVHELWSVFDFLMPGFLGTVEDFRRRYERPIQENRDTDALYRLKRRVQPFMLRRTKESELKELPPKIEQVSPCALTPEQVVVYTRTLEAVKRDIFQAVETKGFERSRIEILASLMRLRRVCDHPALVDTRLPHTEELSGKMAYALELIREASAGGHKTLLFSQFTSMLDILREALNAEGIGHCTIEGRTRDRQAEVERFNTDPSASVFLLSLRAGGTGLTLTAADTVVLFDPWWNPMAEQQAMDRAHRIGQRRTVNVYKLITRETIEEKVLALQERKRRVFDALVSENAEAMQQLTWQDVQELFG
jgi:SNF2 family DNA or RNA helicase